MSAKPTILAVDDVPANLELLVSLLKPNYVVKVAISGRRALEIAEEKPPDLVLLDVMMPEMNGFEVCRLMKANPILRDTPIIFVSARGDESEVVHGFECGAVDYITKPVKVQELEARVSTHLELLQQRHKLQESYVQLRDLERLRDDLVHMIVHDMRTPLMNIGNVMQLLPEKLLEDITAGPLLKIARASAKSLTMMVRAVLDVHRMESDGIELKRSHHNLHELAQHAADVVQIDAEFNNAKLDLRGQPVSLSLDREHIMRVFQNLLTNAIKFTPGGKVEILIEATAGGARVAISDNGPGVPQEFHEQIFEKFGQAEGLKRNNVHAIGLGLTYCKLAIEAHGGTIGVDSEIDIGSTFWFTLPKT